MCLQTSRHERDEAEQKLSKMTAENTDLVQRFHHMKSTEVERMNEVNKACEEMVCFLPSSQLHVPYFCCHHHYCDCSCC